MEKLKSAIPSTLKQMISQSSPEDLPSTCTSLLDFFLSLQLFHKMVGELMHPETSLCSKNTDTALEFKRKANHSFSAGDYQNASALYSQALRYAPMDGEDDVSLVSTLHVNRAASLHKMGLFVESLRDSNRAIVLSPRYSKAWYRRGKANASLGNYEDAIRDLKVSLSMELSPTGKSWIRNEFDIILNQLQKTSSSLPKCSKKNLEYFEQSQIELKCVSTPTKGRGMTSTTDVPQASLLHCEEPYAAIVLKHCRETHCHFCLNELPADIVPCPACSISLYCSQQCQVQAGGQRPISNTNNIHDGISEDVESYITSISLASSSGITFANSNEWVTEHKHECEGVHWPAVFPSEIVLAGRVLVKLIEQCKQSGGTTKSKDSLDLSHNYVSMPLEKKLELHIYSIVLTYCLQHSHSAEFPLTGVSASQLVLLVCQIKVNSMAVVHMKSQDSYGSLVLPGKLSPAQDTLTSKIEQVRVGQAIYKTGSLFNHSCQPNAHAYFLSRTLFIRSTEPVAAGCSLELSYGPQVGQWDHKARQQLLEDQYAFKCQCSGCSEINLSDLVINSFSCAKPNCFGAISGVSMVNQEGYYIQDVSSSCSLECPLPVDKCKREDIKKIAHLLIEQNGDSPRLNPGDCLNCGYSHELELSLMTSNKAKSDIQRLRDAIVTREIPTNILFDALRALNLLKSTMHAYSKDIAEAEDNFAEAFCLIGDFQRAMHHSKASIQILEKLYHPKHIVIGNELVKLASIQIFLGEHTARNNINRLASIFAVYYGSHASRIIPYMDSLKSTPLAGVRLM